MNAVSNGDLAPHHVLIEADTTMPQLLLFPAENKVDRIYDRPAVQHRRTGLEIQQQLSWTANDARQHSVRTFMAKHLRLAKRLPDPRNRRPDCHH
ncbi:MAG: hypothetical protein IPJ99_00410 [Betaproteobacteria bacterium]|nr:hypothetical protein [Betaproteobacteria bacterium]